MYFYEFKKIVIYFYEQFYSLMLKKLCLIPDINHIQLSVLKILNDKKPHKFRNVVECIAQEYKVSKNEQERLTPVGKRSAFYVRVTWAVSQLRNTVLLENLERGVLKITERGINVLSKNPKTIDNKLLSQFPEFKKFTGVNKDDSKQIPSSKDHEKKSPIEILEYNYKKLKQNTIEDILSTIKEMHHFSFERLVVELLLKMGYGGPMNEGVVTKKTRDGGIDGIIKEDELGLGKIYVQTKRQKALVTEPNIHTFVGALDGQNAKKGIFITTSCFSSDALKYSEKITGKDLVLIDGNKLSELLFEHNLGVSIHETYKIKKLDSDYFDDL